MTNKEIPEMTTHTWQEVADRRAEAQREIDAAQQALGVAIADGKSVAAARKRLDAALADFAALDAGAAELDRRAHERTRHEDEIRACKLRGEAYRWVAGYLRAAEDALRARHALIEAEERLAAVGENDLVRRVRNMITQGRAAEIPPERQLDTDLLEPIVRYNDTRATFLVEHSGRDLHEVADFGRPFCHTGPLTIASCRELRVKAESLVEAEEESAARAADAANAV